MLLRKSAPALPFRCSCPILEMSQDCDISRHFKGKFKNRRDISARISLYNGTIEKKGGRTYAYFTDNRFEKILWGRAEHYKGSGWRFSLGRTRGICRYRWHIRSGKSTLLNMIGGLDVPTSGKVIVDGKDLSTLNDEQLAIFRRRKIGFIFQNYNLVPVLNVYENIALPVELDGDKVDKKFMQEVVRMLALEDKLNNMPNNLSGGQQQRVAIARALISKPAIVLADEPTGNLDSRTSSDVLGLLKVTSQKFHQTLVMITHNNEIAQLADRIVRIEDGKIIE